MQERHPTAVPTSVDLDAFRTDQRARWHRGERVALEEYLARCPRLRENPEGLLDLVYAEIVFRQEQGESPRSQEYIVRFPELVGLLHEQLEVDRGLRSFMQDYERSGGSKPTRMPPTETATPSKIGGFEVVAVVGRGGMGRVFKAYDPMLARHVAIKVPAPEVAAHPVAQQRFVREGRAAAAVVHENVVAIHAVDYAGNEPFLVLEYIAGESLQERIDREGPLPIAEVVRIGRQIAEGLAAAHVLGLVHRDVKPANILLEATTGRVKLTDFGLARAVDDAGITWSGAVTGTPHYMSPEQARSEAVDSRSDLFSLGSLLFAMVAGQPPFQAETPFGILVKVGRERPPTLRNCGRSVPDRLLNIVDRLHSRNPADRFDSAEEVAKALVALDDSALSRTNRKPRYSVMIASAAAILLMLVTISVVLPSRPSRSEHSATVGHRPHDPVSGDRGRGSIPKPKPRPDPAPEISSISAKTYVRQGEALARKGSQREAIAELDRAIALDPKDPEAYNLRGWAYQGLGDQNKAIADFSAAVALRPRFWGDYAQRAYSYALLKDTDRCIADYEQAARLLPDTAQYTSTRVDYLNWSAAALADAGRLDEALSKCEAGDRLNPARGTGPRAYLLVRYLEATDPEGKNPALNSRREEALAAEDEAIRLNPNDAQCYYDRAIVHTMRGEADAALADCDAALKFRPDWIDLHYRRGIVHATLKGDYTKALADMEEANRADPNNAAVRSWLARLRARGAGSR